MPSPLKPSAGTRPPRPVLQDSPPDDWLCIWVYTQAVWSCPDGQEGEGYWELKYVNAACLAHARLAAA